MLCHEHALSFLFTDFYKALVQCIYVSLQEKEKKNGHMKKWLYEEATNSLNLQSGGSFIKVILRRLDSEIIDAFSTIIAMVDINYNLELLANSSPDLVQFWLIAFEHLSICDTREYTVMAKESTLFLRQNSFYCCFPFSFIFQHYIVKELKLKCSTLGKSDVYMYNVYDNYYSN